MIIFFNMFSCLFFMAILCVCHYSRLPFFSVNVNVLCSHSVSCPSFTTWTIYTTIQLSYYAQYKLSASFLNYNCYYFLGLSIRHSASHWANYSIPAFRVCYLVAKVLMSMILMYKVVIHSPLPSYSRPSTTTLK